MVFSAFNSYIGTEDSYTEPQFVVISDYMIDANFLLHHFVSHYLKDNRYISVLGFAQTDTHYTTAGHKLGLNLQNVKDGRTLYVIDGLKMLLDGFIGEQEKGVFCDPRASSFSLKPLWRMIRDRIQETKERNGHLVIIDDLTALLNVGVSLQVVLDFVHYCKVLVEKSNVSMVILCHSNDDDEEYTSLLSHLKGYSTLHIHVNALKSGYSRDISGEMQITKYSKTVSLLNTHRLLHFKLLDKDVRFFAPGTSTAVL